MNKILVLGYFGLQTNQLDGQTVKTRDLYRLVSQEFDNVEYYDTEDFKINKLLWEQIPTTHIIIPIIKSFVKYFLL